MPKEIFFPLTCEPLNLIFVFHRFFPKREHTSRFTVNLNVFIEMMFHMVIIFQINAYIVSCPTILFQYRQVQK